MFSCFIVFDNVNMAKMFSPTFLSHITAPKEGVYGWSKFEVVLTKNVY